MTMKNQSMKTSIVAFLDFLGYEQLIASMSEDIDKLNDELNKLNAAISEAENFITIESFKYKFFTDNLIVSTEIQAHDKGEGPLGNILEALAMYQLIITSHGYFIRGGFEAGYNYMDDKIVFGDALIVAHYLESQVACYPRIITGTKLKKLIKEHSRWYGGFKNTPHNDVLGFASDDLYIDYLKGSLMYCDEDYSAIKERVIKHKEHIERELARQTEPKILKKYKWLKEYHNSFCKTVPAYRKIIIS